jgi:four helix bundle protein
MDKPYDFRERAFLFGVEVVAFCRMVARRDAILRHISYQLVDSGTSIGANLAESSAGQSKADFISKQAIALKESKETRFWLRVIAASEPPIASAARPLMREAEEFVSMLTKSIKTARSRPDRGKPPQP